MTDPISTPAQMREAAARLVDEKHYAYITANGHNPAYYVSEYSNLSAAIRAMPVAEPLCTWPSCNHTAKGQCRTYSSGQMLAPNDASSTATNTPGAEPERPADKIMTGLAEAKAFQDAILTGTGIMRGGKYVTPQEFFAEPEPQAPVTLTYTNWRGETAERTIVPKRVWFGVTEWHPEPQWLLRAFDVEKRAERDFVLKDFGQKPEPQAAKVKPLQWVFHDATRNYSAVYISDGWTISRKGTGHFVLYNREFNEGMDRAYQTLEGAQAAAEADHAARILSQIEAVSAAQVRAEALEEAAKLPPYDGDGDPAGPFDHHVFVKRDAIRALIEKEPT